jgi:DNA repair protein RecO (recombination protein O)
MIHKTKGIVLRSVKYGETSLVVTIYTELFGIQTYMVNGVRVSSRKGSGKANMFHPASILDMVVYHNEMKNLQRIKEFKWGFLYQQVFSNVIKNTVALYMVELLQRCLKQPEANPELFYFAEKSLLQLDAANNTIAANLPLYFTLQLCAELGFKMHGTHCADTPFLNLAEGVFSHEKPLHNNYLEDQLSSVTSRIANAENVAFLNEISLNQDVRRQLLQAYQLYVALHVQDFTPLKSLPVLQEVLN